MKREDAKEHDVVVTTANVLVDAPRTYAKVGTKGTIVHIYADEHASGCLVEFHEFQPKCDGVAFARFDEIERR